MCGDGGRDLSEPPGELFKSVSDTGAPILILWGWVVAGLGEEDFQALLSSCLMTCHHPPTSHPLFYFLFFRMGSGVRQTWVFIQTQHVLLLIDLVYSPLKAGPEDHVSLVCNSPQ